MDTLFVRLLREEAELREAAEFMNRVAFERERSSPPPLPQLLFAASVNGAVAGTVGMDYGTDQKPFTLESHWKFDASNTPLPFVREEIIVIGRWMATEPRVSAAVLLAALFVARSNGKQYCFCEMKEKVARHTVALGFGTLPIGDAELLIDRIPEECRPYYESSPPRLYMLRLGSMQDALWSVAHPARDIQLQFLTSHAENAL